MPTRPTTPPSSPSHRQSISSPRTTSRSRRTQRPCSPASFALEYGASRPRCRVTPTRHTRCHDEALRRLPPHEHRGQPGARGFAAMAASGSSTSSSRPSEARSWPCTTTSTAGSPLQACKGCALHPRRTCYTEFCSVWSIWLNPGKPGPGLHGRNRCPARPLPVPTLERPCPPPAGPARKGPSG